MRYLILFALMSCFACSPRISKQPGVTNGNKNFETTRTLTILSYNIHHCNPPSAGTLIDVDTIAGVIRRYDPDVVALQEVDVRTKRSGGVDQAALLGEKTGMRSWFFKAIDHDGGEYGIAILSKLTVLEFRQYKLPTVPESKGEPRILATVTLKGIDGKNLVFACTHLDAQSNSENRLLQIREITDLLKDNPLPVIIAGDLNAAPGSEVINIFDAAFTRSCTDCAFTIPVLNPNKTIDFVGYRPEVMFEINSHEVIRETYASDHLPVLVKLKVK